MCFVAPQSQNPQKTGYTNLVYQKDYVMYRNLFFLVQNKKLYIHAKFWVNWMIRSEVIFSSTPGKLFLRTIFQSL